MVADQTQFPVASALPAASALGTNVKTNVPKIYDIMRGCKEKKTGCMQPAVDEIVALCLSADLAYKKNILGRNCGIHPEIVQDLVLTRSMHKIWPSRFHSKGTPSPNSKIQWASKRPTRGRRLHQPKTSS